MRRGGDGIRAALQALNGAKEKDLVVPNWAADGAAVLTSPLGAALEGAGFRPTPRGLRLRP